MIFTLGGDINYKKDKKSKLLVLAIVTILCIYFIYNIYCQIKHKSCTYNQRQTKKHFKQLHGDAFDEMAKKTIKYGEAIKSPTAIDHYQLGTVYLVNANNHQKAHHHFKKALNHIIQGRVDLKEMPFLLDRINDYKNAFVDFPNIDELPMQAALLQYYNESKKVIHKNKQATPDKDDPLFTQKVLLSRKQWESDSQNVHDSNIQEVLKHQFMHVRECNANNHQLAQYTYKNFVTWITSYFVDQVCAHKVNKVLNLFNHNYTINYLPNAKEQDLVVAVWQRCHDEKNKDNLDLLLAAFGSSILDCVEGDSVVCMSGRNPKIWQTLAHLDFEPSIGILKNKQMVRNEVYERAAQIVHYNLNNISEELKKAYQNGYETAQVNELIEYIRYQINQLYNEYKNQLPEQQLRLILEECSAVI